MVDTAHWHLTFSGLITEESGRALRASIALAYGKGATAATLLFSSLGGRAEESMALSAYIQAHPLDLHMHAAGFVSSAAVPVFLASESRAADPAARFLVHGGYGAPAAFGMQSIAGLKDNVAVLDALNEWERGVLRERTSLPSSVIAAYGTQAGPSLFDAEAALEFGLVQSITPARIAADAAPCIVSW